MSSTMVSTFMNDELALRSNYHDFSLLQRGAVDNAEIAAVNAFSVCGLVGRTPAARRHSSSTFGTSVQAKPVSSIPSFNDSALVNAGILETVAEERFRNRAYSEGSSNLGCEQQQQQQQQNQTTSRYKTELCRPFEENGRCKYGDKCQFAHGKHEIRHMVRHPKYKTELCRTYHTDGICPYGPRCHFIHNTEDLNAVSRQSSVNGLGIQSHPISLPVAINNQQKRPSNLQLMSRHRTIGRLNSFPAYSPSKVNTSPIGTPPGFYGVGDRMVSPDCAAITGPVFNFSKVPQSPLEIQRANVFGGYEVSDNRQGTPPLATFDVFTQGSKFVDLASSEDGVFEGPLTPPDSDRESDAGSPQGSTGGAISNSPQRLPIFRCLSQSD